MAYGLKLARQLAKRHSKRVARDEDSRRGKKVSKWRKVRNANVVRKCRVLSSLEMECNKRSHGKDKL